MEPQLDELAAGSLWRAARLQGFEERARALGLLDDPAVRSALRGIAQHTAELNTLGTLQSTGVKTRPWWADGEYDDARADAANDAGIAFLARKEPRTAYDAFTEAIRLSPLKAAYHANRAAVALQLGNFAGAAADAEQAVQLCPDHSAARLRAARALVAMHTPERAITHYDHVLRLQPRHAAAKAGRAEACSLLEQQARGTQQDTASALRGERPALSREPISDDAAAEQLLAAEEMLRAQPTMEAPKCALVEALILCRSYAAALDACARLQQDSLDAAYLKAEAEWRRGEPTIAKATLQLVCAKQSGKVDELAAFVTRLTADLAAADFAAAHAVTAVDARARYTALLGMDALQRTHMQAVLFRRRAALQETALARADIDQALRLNPNDVEALLFRAQLHRAAGDEQRCFLDLRAAQILAPQRAGAWQAVQAAAKTALRQHRARSGPAMPSGLSDEVLPKSYRVLGVKLTATQREITHAYRMLAAKWHPDKWATAPSDQQTLAKHRFGVVADAYDTLRDPEARAQHDRAHFFSAQRNNV